MKRRFDYMKAVIELLWAGAGLAITCSMKTKKAILLLNCANHPPASYVLNIANTRQENKYTRKGRCELAHWNEIKVEMGNTKHCEEQMFV